LEACADPPLLVAHSMGCLLSVCWAAKHQSDRPIRGAFLVAPPNFRRDGFPSRSFTNVPNFLIPCPLVVIASSNDPYCPIEVAEQMAKRWGAGFVCVGVFKCSIEELYKNSSVSKQDKVSRGITSKALHSSVQIGRMDLKLVSIWVKKIERISRTSILLP
jgi:pimeloyl-ACP methyl ester carboxylesterase